MKKPIPWVYILAFAILIAAVFMLGRCSGTRKDIVDTKAADSARIADKARGLQYSIDSTALYASAKRTDSVIGYWQRDIEAFSLQTLRQEQIIKQLSKPVIIPGRPDLINVPDTCKDLAIASLKLVELNEEGRLKQRELDLQVTRARIVADSILFLCEVDRAAEVASRAVMEDAYNRLKRENLRSKAALYAGATGIYNPLVYGVGGTLMFNTGNTLYGVAGYITNGKPAYEVRVLKKISFRK